MSLNEVVSQGKAHFDLSDTVTHVVVSLDGFALLLAQFGMWAEQQIDLVLPCEIILRVMGRRLVFPEPFNACQDEISELFAFTTEGTRMPTMSIEGKGVRRDFAPSRTSQRLVTDCNGALRSYRIKYALKDIRADITDYLRCNINIRHLAKKQILSLQHAIDKGPKLQQ